MSTETEVKVKIEDPEDFCGRLGAFAHDILSVRHLEDNYLFDFPDQRLRSAQSLLRIRFAEGRSILTYKGPPRPEGIFKSREELETGLSDGAILVDVLGRVGLSVCFRYQKYRREFVLGDIHVAVDETPIGNYVEFEGSEDGILDLTRRMGIAKSQLLRSSYYSLYVEYRGKHPEAPQAMVF